MNTFVVLILVANIVLIVLVAVYISKSMKNETGTNKSFNGDVELVHDNVLLQDDLRGFSDEVLSKIDQRMTQLRKLIKEADDRINTLETMSSNIRDETRANAPAPTRRRAAEETEEEIDPNSKGLGSNRNATIVRLSRRGMSSAEIAQEVGMGRGEIELILSVENSRKKA